VGGETTVTQVVDVMARVKTAVDELILQRLLPTSSPIKEVALLYKMMRDYPERPAKGLRPLLCVTTCKAFGGSEDDALLTAACLELLHDWILIHDDIEDASELRRGEPVLHRKYDEFLAMNAGDALHARMWGVLLQNRQRLDAETSLRILEEFSTMINETTEGQHMELVWVADRRWDLDESDYVTMVRKKTAWYTVAGPCRLGAIIAGAPTNDVEGLVDFGLTFGTAFQIRDDILNLESAASGKEKADDLLEGKRTLLLLKLIELASSGEKARVLAIMDKTRSAKTEDDVRYVLALMQAYGILDYAQQRAKQFLDAALQILGTIGWRGDPDALEVLREVARFSIERQW
jgi:geranylgeranyl diphosphate synthase type II